MRCAGDKLCDCPKHPEQRPPPCSPWLPKEQSQTREHWLQMGANLAREPQSQVLILVLLLARCVTLWGSQCLSGTWRVAGAQKCWVSSLLLPTVLPKTQSHFLRVIGDIRRPLPLTPSMKPTLPAFLVLHSNDQHLRKDQIQAQSRQVQDSMVSCLAQCQELCSFNTVAWVVVPASSLRPVWTCWNSSSVH